MLAHARRQDRILFLRLWQKLGHGLEWFHGRKLAKTLAVLAVAAVVVGAFCFVPWEYRVVGKGKLMPICRREIFAPENGEVIRIVVHDREKVQQGPALLDLRNEQLQAEFNDNESKLSQALQQARSFVAEENLAEKDGDGPAKLKAASNRLKADLEAEGLARILKIQRVRVDSLKVTSPIDGVVAGFQLEQLLQNRPVQQGELLLEVMQDTGPWRLELEVEGSRMGHVLARLERQPRPQAGRRLHPGDRPRIDFSRRIGPDRHPFGRLVRAEQHFRVLRLDRREANPQPADRGRGPRQNQLRQTESGLRPLRRRDRIHPPAALALNRFFWFFCGVKKGPCTTEKSVAALFERAFQKAARIFPRPKPIDA